MPRLLSTILLLLLAAAPAAAGDSMDSYDRARAALDRAVAALGGPDALERSGDLSLSGAGTLDVGVEFQGLRPGEPTRLPFEERLVLDRPHDRVGFEHAFTRQDGNREHIRFVYQGEDEMIFTHLVDRFAYWGVNDDFAAARRRRERMVPHELLREALRQASSLRHLGTATIDGRRVEQVSFALGGADAGRLMTLHLDSETGLPRGFETLVATQMLGDATVRWSYGDYRPVEGLGPYPSGYRILLEDEVYKDVRYEEIRPGAAAGSPMFKTPEGIEPPTPPERPAPAAEPAPPPRPRVIETAPGVYYVHGVRTGFGVMFVEMADHLVVFEAPSGYVMLDLVPATDFVAGSTPGSVTEDLLRAIEETVPGKPVRAVAVSHFHGDHAGGLRPFVARGATILTTPAGVAAYRRMAERSHSMAPDALSGREAEPRFEVFSGRHTVTDGSRTIELIEVDPNPHAEGAFVMYLPAEKILYAHDFFQATRLEGFPSEGHVPIMRFFVGWLDEQGLEPVKVFGAHGAGAGSPEHLQKIRELSSPAAEGSTP